MTVTRTGRAGLVCTALAVFWALHGGWSVLAIGLVEGGTGRATIIVPQKPPAHVAEVADELAGYIEKASGARLPVTADPDEVRTRARLWVGFRQELTDIFAGTDLELRHPEEIVLVARGEDLALFGRDRIVADSTVEHGTEHAVYVFLHEHLGVRWLWPGELGEEVERRETIRFDDFEQRYHPQLRQRHLRILNHERSISRLSRMPEVPDLNALMRQKDSATEDWSRRNHGLRRSLIMAAGHAFGRWWANYHEEHLDYFALHPDGSRDPLPKADRVKLCVSNPAVAEQWLENAERRLQAAPALIMISASPNDSAYTGKCWCETCRSWDHLDGPKVTLRWRGHEEESPALTDRYVRFWNILAHGLRERFPEREAFVGAWAYGPYRTPPIGIELADNVAIGFVGNLPVDTLGPRERDLELWRQWAEKARVLIWRPNLFHRAGPLNASSGPIGFPMVFFSRFAEDFAFLARHRMVGLDVDSIFNHWATQGPQYYLLSRMAWDPFADADVIMADYYRRGFGPAAPAVADYFHMWEELQYELFEAAEGKNQLAMVDVFPVFYSPEVRARAGEHLDRAAALAAGAASVYAERIEFLRTGLAWVHAQIETMEAINVLRRGAVGGEELRENVRRAVAACDARDKLLIDNAAGFAIGFAQYLSSSEHRRMDRILGPVEQRHLDLLAAEVSIVPLPNEWDFRIDPDNVGTEAGWFREENAPQDWTRILVTDWWGNQLASEDQDDPEKRKYLGVGWYRLNFEAEPLPRDQRLWLEFGAVDESCWVYVNGQPAGGHLYDGRVDTDAWRKPRRFDITDVVRPGRNSLVVKVQALAGQGGIWQGAFLRPAPANLWPNGGFDAGAEGWRVSTEQHHRVELGLGRYVGEQSLRVEKKNREISQLNSTARLQIAPGRYLLTIRCRQDPRRNAANPARVRLSFYPAGDGEGQETKRVWLAIPLDATGDHWREFNATVQVGDDQSYNRARVDVMLYEPGTYWVDEVSLQKVED